MEEHPQRIREDGRGGSQGETGKGIAFEIQINKISNTEKEKSQPSRSTGGRGMGLRVCGEVEIQVVHNALWIVRGLGA